MDSTATREVTPNVYMESPLDENALAGDTLHDHTDLLLWSSSSGQHGGNEQGCGEDGYPIFELYPPGQPPKHTLVSSPAPAAAVPAVLDSISASSQSQAVWFPPHLSVGQLCAHVLARQFNTSLKQCPLLRVDLLQLVAHRDGGVRYGKSASWETQCLLKQGEWQVSGSEQCKRRGEGQTWESVLFGEFSGGEIFVDTGKMSLCPLSPGASLASLEADRRTRQWSIRVKYEDEVKTGRGLDDIAAELRMEFLAANTTAAAALNDGQWKELWSTDAYLSLM